jgi:threonine 3-dehydrogenase
MQALLKTESSAGLWLHDVAMPTITDDDVLIRIRKTGICGTDIHIWNWDEWARKTVPMPMIIGHEYTGEIAEVGANVKRVRVGQRVSGEGHLIDPDCPAARAGNFHLDPNTRSVGVNHPGAFAEYIALPAFNVIALPDDIDDELAAILDPLGNAVHVALSFDLVGNNVVIMGAGPIGIMAAAVARHAGAAMICIADINPVRLKLAEMVPDVVTVDLRHTTVNDVAMKHGVRHGFPIAFEMSGSSEGLATLIDAMATGGRLACLGLPAGKMTVDWSTIVCKSLTLKGIYGREMFETWRKSIAMLQHGLNIRDIITHRIPARDFEQGFAAMKSGSAGKVVMTWAE